ncbi:helix-turn-helix domain-containing protein [Terriglobus albidus]|uniref:Helix-turn-helix domain-containing protein n=1 Tax=Terriglobus albidus TaxID=1592106 RepID=A0A5B9EFI0_9BACT|nr:substrate-binding domain-containing protein [Terriglobus albidus]QEE29865.1 helix-turn-helix domain-containing protein [Terriglobus albidus]
MGPLKQVERRSNMQTSRRSDRNESQTVLRACEVLKAFKSLGEELTLLEVMERAQLPKTTAFRLLRTLIHGGLLERVGAGVYRNRFGPVTGRRYRIGFATQGVTEFSQEVLRSIETVAARENVDLITVDNRYSAREALRNADFLIREGVDLVLEFQTYERVAPAIASKFLEAKTPVIAIEVPHPGATYFGANNYKAGVIAGKALGRWANDNWNGRVDRVVLMELPIAGSLLELRGTGFLHGLQSELPEIASASVVHLNGRGDFEQVQEMLRKYLRRARAKRTLVGTVNDICALAAVRVWEEFGAEKTCAVASQNATPEARAELRRLGTRLIGSVAYFPERYGNYVIPLALNLLRNKPVAPAVFVKHQFLTPKNVDLVYPLDTGAKLRRPRLNA